MLIEIKRTPKKNSEIVKVQSERWENTELLDILGHYGQIFNLSNLCRNLKATPGSWLHVASGTDLETLSFWYFRKK